MHNRQHFIVGQSEAVAHNKMITAKLQSHTNYYEFRLDLNPSYAFLTKPAQKTRSFEVESFQ